MNNTFNFKRFGMLMGKHTAEHYKMYLMSIGVLTGLMALIGGFIFYTANGHVNANFQFAIFMSSFLVTGVIFTSIIFSELGDRRRSIPLLTLPASHFEKFLVAWIYSFLIFQIVFLLCFYVVDYSLLSLYKDHNQGRIELLNFFEFDKEYLKVFILFAFLHSMGFFGAVCFNKNHFIKSAMVVFAFGFMLVLINKPIADVIFGFDLVKAIPFTDAIIRENKKEYAVVADSGAIGLVNYALYTVIAALWAGAYFKLKEKEV